jgi:ankyrin repeat protein
VLQEGMLPIHFAAMFNRLDCVAMLLDRGSYMQQPPAKKVSHERCVHSIMV